MGIAEDGDGLVVDDAKDLPHGLCPHVGGQRLAQKVNDLGAQVRLACGCRRLALGQQGLDDLVRQGLGLVGGLQHGAAHKMHRLRLTGVEIVQGEAGAGGKMLLATGTQQVANVYRNLAKIDIDGTRG